MSDLNHVRVEWDRELAIVTVNRQEKMNALNAEVIAEIGEAFAGLARDEDVRGVILTGAGEKAFVAGAVIAELADMTAVTAKDTSARGQAMCDAIEQSPFPGIGASNGFALGGGLAWQGNGSRGAPGRRRGPVYARVRPAKRRPSMGW